MHALFIASDIDDFVLSNLYQRLIFEELIPQNKKVIIYLLAYRKL